MIILTLIMSLEEIVICKERFTEHHVITVLKFLNVSLTGLKVRSTFVCAIGYWQRYFDYRIVWF